MKPWESLRDSRYGPRFLADLQGLDVDVQAWDQIVAPEVEIVLCGAALDALDEAYPPLFGRFRLLIVDQNWLMPALRVAFSIDDDGAVLYERVALQPPRG